MLILKISYLISLIKFKEWKMKKQRNVTEFQKLSDHELEQVYGGISWANYLLSYLKEDYKYFLSDGSKNLL